MHRIDDSKFLLYIEPSIDQRSQYPIDDDITKVVEQYLLKSVKGTSDYSNLTSNGSFTEGYGWRGFHTTECGEWSGNSDHLLENGMITNSLCVFYLMYYRSYIPDSEMEKVMNLYNFANAK